jgi:hypothetical protein
MPSKKGKRRGSKKATNEQKQGNDITTLLKKYEQENVITTNELENILKDAGYNVTTDNVNALKMLLNDNEKQGTLSVQKIIQWWPEGKNIVEDEQSLRYLTDAAASFNKFETNVLSTDQFKEMYTDIDDTMIQKHPFDELVTVLDSSNEGKIKFSDYFGWLKDHIIDQRAKEETQLLEASEIKQEILEEQNIQEEKHTGQDNVTQEEEHVRQMAQQEESAKLEEQKRIMQERELEEERQKLERLRQEELVRLKEEEEAIRKETQVEEAREELEEINNAQKETEALLKIETEAKKEAENREAQRKLEEEEAERRRKQQKEEQEELRKQQELEKLEQEKEEKLRLEREQAQLQESLKKQEEEQRKLEEQPLHEESFKQEAQKKKLEEEKLAEQKEKQRLKVVQEQQERARKEEAERQEQEKVLTSAPVVRKEIDIGRESEEFTEDHPLITDKKHAKKEPSFMNILTCGLCGN